MSKKEVEVEVESNEEKKIEQEQTNLETKNDLINALKQDFATNVNRIYINSIGKEFGFREITVLEQKTLSRIMIDNESRKDVIFDAQCALINKVCLDEGFNIYNLTEFDRLKLLIAIYQANMYKNEIRFTCPRCGTQNSYKLDFGNVLYRLDKIIVENKTFVYENKNYKYEFTVGYPSVRYISKFHKGNVARYKGLSKDAVKNIDKQVNLDYVDLYIKHIKIENKITKLVKNIRISDYEPKDVEEILSIFPQDVMYSEDGVLKFITNEFIKKINDSFDDQTCYNCGEVYENTVHGASSFL